VADAQRQLTRIESAQQRLLAPLAQLNATVIYRVQRVYNGIAVKVDSNRLAEIARLPGVKALHPLINKQRNNSSSVPLIGAPQLWDSAGLNVTGTDIKVGIIDTGIDYIHTTFGGSGLPADYTRNITDSISESPALFPSAKVVGGFDFVGDAYDGENALAPDSDPMDCPVELGGGHGSHVAGTAGGFGVNADGTTYTGPYGPTTNFGGLRIGPGVAPGAKLYALRVFGCDGSTEVVDQALEWAADPNGDGNFSDHLDVINMSLGSDFGETIDSTSVASENAIAVGVIVVASAGNSGDTTFIHGSPGTAEGVISVASSVDALSIIDRIDVTAPPAIANDPQAELASFSVAYDWANEPPVSGAVVYPPTQRTGCEDFTLANAALIAGKIALLDWTDGECGSVTRTAKVVAAGGIGAILVEDLDFFDLFITGSAVIPSVSVPKATGDLLKANLIGLTVTFDGSLANTGQLNDPAVADTLSAFSSRGPRRAGALKPDITAPGESIFSTKSGSGNQGTTLSGTSMAAPHVAGAMALLRQLHPTWTVAQLKALAMNTATKDLRSASDVNAQIFSPARVGAGRINLPNAATQSVIIYNKAKPNQVSLSFGAQEITGTTTLSKLVTVVNKGAGSVTYNLSYTPVSNIPGVSYSVAPAQVTLAAGASTDVNVTMTANPALMKHTIEPALLDTQLGDSRHWLSEAAGYLTLSVPAANMNFSAAVHGYYENPPVVTDYSAAATFIYTDSTNTLGYDVRFTTPVTLTAGHIHSGPAGINGPVTHPLNAAVANISREAGNVVLSAAEEVLLLNGGLYVNFHTAANPGGELRGQIVPTSPELRLPIFTAARPASQMKAQSPKLALGSPGVPSATTAITLTGTGLNTGAAPPLDEQALVTALELQYSSPQIVSSSLITGSADLRYVGVTSDFAPTSVVSETTLYFGVATHSNWSTPNEVEFDIFIDTDRDGIDDYVLFNTSVFDGTDATDILVSTLCDLNNGGCVDQDYLNGLPASLYNTVPFNTNILVIPVLASDLGLNNASSGFNYSVATFAFIEQDPSIDSTPRLSYDVAKPGVRFSGGVSGLPIFFDVPGAAIPVAYNRNNLLANASKGVLLLHHHNLAGTHAEAVTTPTFVLLPLIRR
jgi:subtilisin family serine protease